MRTAWTVAAAVLVLVLAPQGTTAQQADGWWDWALREFVDMRRGDTFPDRRGEIILDRRDRGPAGRGARGGGPPFCANGQGHPVHGRQWCRDKGFGTGGGVIFERRRWDDAVFRGADRRRGALDRGGLIDVLGDVVLGRVAAEGSRLGAHEPLSGRWIMPEGSARVLQIRSGQIPIAELTDLNGDGRIDAVLISQRH
jgi:hypothetical protein